jgi:hypothetical protein
VHLRDPLFVASVVLLVVAGLAFRFRDSGAAEPEGLEVAKTFRPSLARASLVGVIAALLGAFCVMADDAPVLIRISGALFLVAGPITIAIAVTTRVEIGDRHVVIRQLRRVRRFEPPTAAVKVLNLPVGYFHTDQALHVESPDQRITIHLGFFSPPDRTLVIDNVRESLR